MDIFELYHLFFSICLGAIIGSFLNVVIYRLPRDESVVTKSSHCPKCKAKIRFYDNIPIISYVILFGKCRRCKARIEFRYFMVEVITAVLFATCYRKFGWEVFTFARAWPLMGVLVAVAFIDLRHRIIPDELSIGGTLYGLFTAWLDPIVEWWKFLVGAGFGFSVFFGFAWVYYKLTGKSGLGGGDIKFLALVGAFTGVSGVFSTILISSVTGSVIGIAYALANRKQGVMGLAIPYGPFLVIGVLAHFLLGELLWFRLTIPI